MTVPSSMGIFKFVWLFVDQLLLINLEIGTMGPSLDISTLLSSGFENKSLKESLSVSLMIVPTMYYSKGELQSAITSSSVSVCGGAGGEACYVANGPVAIGLTWPPNFGAGIDPGSTPWK